MLLGGAGFIGSALARLLASRGEAFRIADIRPSPVAPQTWMRADVRDADMVAQACDGAATLFLLAAEHGLEPRPDRQFEAVNVGGARSVVAAAERVGLRRIVFTSTVAVYGLTGAAADEDSACRPSGAYGRTKLEAERILRAWQAKDPARVLVILRPTLVFGAGVRGHMRSLLHQLARPGFVMIGDGHNRKSLAFVDNLAAFHVHVASTAEGLQVYNYADGPDLTMAELTATVRGAIGLGAPQRRQSRSQALLGALLRAARGDRMAPLFSQVQRFCADSRFVSSRVAGTGFEPPVALADALRSYARSDLRWVTAAAGAAPGPRVPAA